MTNNSRDLWGFFFFFVTEGVVGRGVVWWVGGWVGG